MAEPCLRHEVRGSHRTQRELLPLTLTLSRHAEGMLRMMKNGERQ
jgi:hypothetical protein